MNNPNNESVRIPMGIACLLLFAACPAIAQDGDLDFLFEDSSSAEASASSEPEPAEESAGAGVGQAQEPPPQEAAATTETDTQPPPDPALEQPDNTRRAPETLARGSKSRLVEEIVVTAQRREENLKDVPISVQAFTQQKLDVLGIDSVQDIQRATPGFTVTSAASFNVVFLRGVGSDAFLPGVDSSVPFLIDGVPLVFAQGTSDTLGRVKRVEVLKGPQGTLFGRNATGGVVQIVTPDPGDEFEADLQVEYGSDDTRNFVGYFNVPITDSLGVNGSLFSNERENIVNNLSTGRLPPKVFGRGARVKLKWDTTDDLAFTLAGNYNETANNGGIAFQNVRPSPALAAGGFALPADETGLDRTVDLDGDAGAESEGWFVSGTVDWRFIDPLDSKLIVSTQEITPTRVDGPFDGTRRPVVDAHGAGFMGRAEQFVEQDTLELQLLSNENTPFSEYFEFVTGVFVLRSLGGFNPIVFNVFSNVANQFGDSFGFSDGGAFQPFTDAANDALAAANLPPVLGDEGFQLANYGLLDSESESVFGQANWFLLDNLTLTTGLRYQEERRELIGSRTSFLLEDGSEVVIPFPEQDQTVVTAEQVSARLALQWRPGGGNDQIYASWARAYKSPTFNTVNVTNDLFPTSGPLDEERVDTYELGTKTQFFSGALQFNGAVFYTIQEDPLSANVSIISGGIANFTNAGQAEIRGAEGDLLVLPMPELNPGLALTGAFSYLDAIYTDFRNGRGYDDETGLGFGNGGASLPERDLSGNRIPRVPEWSWQASINQRIDLNAAHTLEIGGGGFYNSEIFFLPQNSNLSRRRPVYLFNAHLSYFYNPWQLELTAFGNNLSDEIYAESAFVTDFGTSLLVNENPRAYGLRAKVTF